MYLFLGTILFIAGAAILLITEGEAEGAWFTFAIGVVLLLAATGI